MFLLNPQGKEPIYDQIRKQIRRFIETGILKENDRLPSVRQLASENGINPNTVAKAYQELEKEGIIYTLPKKGVYVSQRENIRQTDYQVLATFLKPLKDDGLKKETLLAFVEELYAEDGNVKS